MNKNKNKNEKKKHWRTFILIHKYEHFFFLLRKKEIVGHTQFYMIYNWIWNVYETYVATKCGIKWYWKFSFIFCLCCESFSILFLLPLIWVSVIFHVRKWKTKKQQQRSQQTVVVQNETKFIINMQATKKMCNLFSMLAI